MIIRAIILFLLIIYNYSIYSKSNRLIIASTTSTYDSGLLDYINNEFTKEFDINVYVLALGTGQAIKTAQQGNADILLVHHKPSEIKFVNEGYGLKRYNLMYNDYLLIGPKNNNFNICLNVKTILKKIKNNENIFLSRGDNSGTHMMEIYLWNSANFNPSNFGKWYKKIGQGMGATLNMANELFAYTITDRGTWLAFKNKNNMKIICESKPPLFNQYGIIAVSPKKNSNVNYTWAKKYISWILSEKGKKLINGYKKSGKQLFFFNFY